MPIDFSQIKAIHIPEGDVKKIEANGVVIWQLEEAVVLQSITLSGQTTSLNRGAAFSFGGTVTAHYSNGSTANVTSSTTFSGYNMNTAGTYTVTASYTENGVTKTATYTLTVNKAWSTLWSGTKTISWKMNSTTTPSDVTVADLTTSSIPSGSNIRITFTMSNKSGGGTVYYKNGSSTTTKPTSPLTNSSFTYNSSSTGYVSNILAVTASRYSTSTTWYRKIQLAFKQNTQVFVLTCTNNDTSTWSDTSTISLKITKIERYY